MEQGFTRSCEAVGPVLGAGGSGDEADTDTVSTQVRWNGSAGIAGEEGKTILGNELKKKT